MPIYTYENREAGLKVDLYRSVDERNDPVYLNGHMLIRSSFVPERVGVLIPGASQDDSFNSRIMQSHYKKEQAEGSRFRSSYTKDQIKEAWSTP